MTSLQTVVSGPGRWGRNLFLLGGFAILVDIVRWPVLSPGAQAAFTDIFETIVVVFGAVACGWAAKRSSTLVRALWAMTGLYLALTAAGDFHDYLVDLRVANAVVLSPLELLGWCTYLPLALMIFLPALDDRWLRWRWLPAIDFTQVAIVVGLAYVRFIYLHHVDLGEGWTHFGRVEEVRNILICSGLLLRAVVEPSKSARSVYKIVGGAFAALTVMKNIFPGGDQAISAIGRPASLLTIGILAACWNARPEQQVATKPEPIKLRLALSIFAAGTMITALMLAYGAPERYRWPTRIVVVVTVLLFLLRNSLADLTRFTAEADLRKSEADLTRAQAVGRIGSWRFDLRNNTLAFSDEAYHILGMSKGASISPQQATDSIYPGDREGVLRAWQSALREGTYNCEFRLLLHGEIRWVHILAEIEFDLEGRPLAAVGTVQDTSERRNSEAALCASEDRYRDLVDHSEDLVCTHDLQGNLLSVNPAPARLLGYTVEELLKIPMRDLIVPAGRTQFEQYLHRLTASGQPEHGLLCVITRTGEIRTWEYRNTLRTDGVSEPIVRGMARDITEQRVAELALGNSEQRYRLLFEKNIAGVAISSIDGAVLDCNDAWARILGYDSAREIRGRSTKEFYFEPLDREPLLEEMQRTGACLSQEIRLRRKDGSAAWVLFDSALLLDRSGTPFMQATAIDISERKRAEDQMRSSEQRYRTLFEKTVAGVAIVTMDGRIVDCNDAWARMFGHQGARDCHGLNVVGCFANPADRAPLLEKLTRDGAYFNQELEMKRVDGSRLCLLVNGTLLPAEDGEPLIQTTVMDITARKQAEEALSASERRLRLAQEVARIGTFDRNLRTGENRWTPEMELIYGLPAGTYPQNFEKFIELVHPEDRQRVSDLIGASLETGKAEGEWRVPWPDGTVHWIAGRWQILKDKQGAPERAIGMDYDITARKQAEELLAAQKETLELVARGVPLDQTLTKLVCGIETQLPGLLASVVLLEDDGVHVRHGSGPSLPPALAQGIDGMVIGPVAGSCGTAMYRKETVIVHDVAEDPLWENFRELAICNGIRSCWSTPIFSSEGKVLGSFAIYYREPRSPGEAEMRLIHVATNLASIAIERETAEEALRQSAAELQQAQAVAQMGSWRYDLQKNTVTLSDELYRIIGLPVGTPVGPERTMEILHPDDDARIRNEWTAAEQSGHYDQQCRIVVGGDVRWLHIQARIERDHDGNPAAAVGTAQDVTERREAGEALRQSGERFRVALKDSPITVFSQDRDRRYTWVYNTAFHSSETFLGKTTEEVIGEDSAASLRKAEERVLATGVGERTDVWFMHEGKKRHFEVTLEPLRDASGEIVGLTGASMNVARLRELADSLRDATEKLARERLYLEHEIQTELGFEEVVGQSPNLKEVLKKTRLVAPTDSTVLLLGETGTGKELVARSVHTLSSRREQNFIKLNCAAVPSGLLESELFGHEKGAFTGAVSQKVGRIELADKGTLFLDEVGEMPLELQPKLLRVLQDREFERLGGVHTLRVDVRIIAATNRELQLDVEEKRFRQDLYYRLNVFPIELPPLRERRSDIPMLVEHFVQKHCKRMRKKIGEIPGETMEILQKWNWPGNIRELENMIERMVILSKDGVLALPPTELLGPQEVDDDSLHGIEREHIVRVLRETYGVLSGPDGAASRLGTKRTTLQSMLKRFGIDPQQFRRGTGTFGA